MAKQTLDQWIREALLDDTKEGKCTRFALVHIQGNGQTSEVFNVKLNDKPWDPKELAEMFRQKAQNHAGELAGNQTFNLLAFYADRNEHQAHRPFTIMGWTVDDSHLMTEAPTKDGIVSQCMRHNEAVVQIALKHTAAMAQACMQMVQTVSDTNRHLQTQNNEMFDLLRQSAMAQVQNNNEHEMKKLEFQRASDERKKWLTFGPALINSFLGRDVFPQSTADTSLIDALCESLSEGDIEKLATSGIIKPELWGPLAKRMSSYLKNKNEASEHHRQLMNGKDPIEAELS